MQIWPHSATLSEVGGAQAGSAPAQASAGPGGGSIGMMPAPNAGEVLLNRAETAALAAMEGEEDEDHGFRRAQAESGLSRLQLQTLRRRAQHLSGKGYTLKGQNFVKKPLAAGPDEPGLTRKGVKGEDETVQKPLPAKKVAKEANGFSGALIERTVPPSQDLYTCRDADDYRRPTPNSLSEPETGEHARETNSMTTLAAMLMKRRRAKASGQ